MSNISDYRCRLAYRAGRIAREQGKPLTANNRERGTVYFDDWWSGWNDEDNRIFFQGVYSVPREQSNG